MKLAGIYNVWGDIYLLKHSIENIRPLVDLIIVVFSTTSNFGERLNPGEPDGSTFDFGDGDCPIYFRQMEPNLKLQPRDNETAKRNLGLNIARDFGATHFLSLDSDEMYDAEEFKKAKNVFDDGLIENGTVVKCMTYFKSPILTIGYDITLVPFIHKITPTIRHEFNRNYPYAWDGKQIRIDPTRSLNINSGVRLSTFTMHHMSWVRKDYQKKIRNSTARTNLERSTILEDLANAKPGYHVKFYNKTLTECENKFGMPEF